MRFVTLRLLWDCNLRCVMCDHPHRPRSEMAVATAHAVLDQLGQPVALTFIGGEPCLWLIKHPEVLRRALADGHLVNLITNGVLLPRLPDFVAAFRERAVGVQFSIDGFEASYERIRLRARWADLVAAIRLVQTTRREAGNSRAIVRANYLLMRSTLADLPRFVEFCVAEGIDAVSLSYTMIYDSMVARGAIGEDESPYHHMAATNDAVAQALELARESGLALSAPAPLGSTVLGAAGKRRVNMADRVLDLVPPGRSPLPPGVALPCDKPWKEAFVYQDGSIVPCCTGPKLGPVLGTIGDGLAAAWASPRAQEVRVHLAAGAMHPACRCGINVSTVGRQSSPGHFFTRIRDQPATDGGAP